MSPPALRTAMVHAAIASSAAAFGCAAQTSPGAGSSLEDAGPRMGPDADGLPWVDSGLAPPLADGAMGNSRPMDAAASDAIVDVALSEGGSGSSTPLPSADGGGDQAPPGFWDTSNIPAAKNAMMFKFLNRTNGTYADTQVYWSFKSGSISETHSIADQPLYDMPANSSGRVYFYLCAASDTTCASDPTKSKYFDFIEHTIGPHQYNGNTTRVDAFGIKIAMRLHCSDGYDVAVGEDYETFQEDRAITFQKFIDAVPAEFKPLAQPPNGPYRIVQPGAGGFGQGGANSNYYDSFVNELWSANGLTIAKPGPNASGLGSYPDVSAAIYRHVGAVAGTFTAAGKLMNQKLWADGSTFYGAAPADYYAQFWHAHALGGKAYGFPYDDVGGYSSYISHANPQYLLVAIGW